jgi:thioredoxin reductase (NADPH)
LNFPAIALARSRAQPCATTHWEEFLSQIFMFIGAEPNTTWLDGYLALDGKGYILTGMGAIGVEAPVPLPLQTSPPRVFAIGDVRSGSMKRVASAVGEGAAVVAQIHSLFGASSTTA